MTVWNPCRGLPFGLKGGVPWDVSEVPSGKACGCVCCGCGGALIAKKGEKLRHHFAHDSGADCIGGLETSVHAAAKHALQITKRLMLPGAGDLYQLRQQPDWLRYANRPAATASWLFPAALREFREIDPERSFVVERINQRVRPDATCDGTLLVEFYVSNKVDEQKRQWLIELGLDCVELDLRPFIDDWLGGMRNEDATPAIRHLEEFLHGTEDHRSWLHETRVAQWLTENRIPDYPSASGSQLNLFPDQPRYR